MNRARSLLLICLLGMLTAACHQPATGTEADPATEAGARPYGVGFNFFVHADSLLLQEDRPMHWCQGVAETSDSLWVFRDDILVVAAVTVIPEDCVDSVWVKVARDQGTMGWTHESDLLAAGSPYDPISQFLRLCSGRRPTWFAGGVAAACLAVAIGLLRRRRIPVVHLRDIPSAYPTLLTSTLAVSAWLHALIQHLAPWTWVQFYFHPTLNPLAQPPLLCTFLLTAWLLLLLAVAVAEDVFRLLHAADAAAYLLSLLAWCVAVYLAVTFVARWSLSAAGTLCGCYAAGALILYFRFSRARYYCGHCGRKLRAKGICPHCGTIND